MRKDKKVEKVPTRTADMSTPFLRDINTLRRELELQVGRKITECDGKKPTGRDEEIQRAGEKNRE